MPILTHRCTNCGYVVEKFYHRPHKVSCTKCGGLMKVVPSIPGYRRDHTVIDKDKND